MTEQNVSGPRETHRIRPGDQRQTAAELQLEWSADPRWDGVRRDYTAEDVVALRGRVGEEHTLARRGAERLWEQLQRTEIPASDGTWASDPHWVAASSRAPARYRRASHRVWPMVRDRIEA